MSLPATDDFNGAAAALADPPWTTQQGVPSINGSGVFYGSGGGNSSAFWNPDVFDAGQYSKGIYEGDVFPSVLVRASGVGGSYLYYMMVADDTFGGLYKGTGFDTLVAGANAAWADGDEVYISGSGTLTVHLSGKRNGSEIITFDDSSSPITSGSAGILSGTASGFPGALKSWEGGNLASGAGFLLVKN